MALDLLPDVPNTFLAINMAESGYVKASSKAAEAILKAVLSSCPQAEAVLKNNTTTQRDKDLQDRVRKITCVNGCFFHC